MCAAFRSACPPRCGRVVVDVPVLSVVVVLVFMRCYEQSTIHVFSCIAVAGAPRSCTHEHDEGRESERNVFLYRCLIEFSSVLYIAKKD
jgi:hypothetical protein